MKHWRSLIGLCICIVCTLTSLGCLGNFKPLPVTSVVATANPLVAQYSIRDVHAGFTAWVEFGNDTSYGRQTSVMTSSVTTFPGQTLNILVAGMKPETTYHMRAHVDRPGASWVDQDQTFTTGAITPPPSPTGLSVQMPSISVSTRVPGLTPAPGVEFLSMSQSVVTDQEGSIIWFYPAAASPFKLMSNGHVILQLGSSLREVDLASDTVRDVSVAQVNQSLQANGYSFVILNFSHDVLTLPNGHWITIGQISKAFTDLPGYPGTTNVLGDAVVDIDPNGNVVWGWSAFDYLDVNRHLQGLPDWTHSNALVYTPDGNLLLSMRHQSWILKIDYSNGMGTGNVAWKLGVDGDFALSGGDPSQWFYGQHDPVLLSTDSSLSTLAIYDDGNLRIDSSGEACGTSASAPVCYSRATIFQIDESTLLATLLWQDLPGFFSFWGGSIGILSNGHVEFCSSDPFNASSSQIVEVTQTENPQTVWQMNISGGNAYRGVRVPSLYPSVTWQR
jgi:arylsulfate sulfotransferase